jgi:hypothetical protein
VGWLPAVLDDRAGRVTVPLTSLGAIVTLTGLAIHRELTRGGPPAAPADAVVEGQGLATFVVFAVLVTVAIVAIFRGVARDLRNSSG